MLIRWENRVFSGPRVGTLIALLIIAAGFTGCGDDAPSADSAAATLAPSVEAESTVEPIPTPTAPAAPDVREAAQEQDEPATAEPDSSRALGPWWEPQLREASCPGDLPDGVDCFDFEVAANRSDADHGTIIMPVYVARATGSNPQPDAIVAPGGGPGFAGTANFGFVTESPFLADRDVVAYDQRGTGGAQPSLNCPEREAAIIANLEAADDTAVELDRTVVATQDCLDRLAAEGIDLLDYNSETSAADLDELRELLGYEQWNIVGISYGGRLALATMRSFPDGLRSVILDSPVALSYGGPSAVVEAVNGSVAAVVEDCAASPTCSQRGDVDAMFERVRLRYNDAPVPVQVPRVDGQRTLLITGDDMMAGMFNALYVADLIPLLPIFLSQLDEGNTTIVSQLVVDAIPRAVEPSDGMTIAVNCADNAELGTHADDIAIAREPGRWASLLTTELACPRPDWPASSPGFNQPVMSDIPTLAMAGRYDPITPPGPTQETAEALANATYVYAPYGSHSVLFSSGCFESITMAFIDDPTQTLDVSCVDDVPASAFSS